MIYYLQVVLNKHGYCMIMYQASVFDEKVYKEIKIKPYSFLMLIK